LSQVDALDGADELRLVLFGKRHKDSEKPP
jgi:hypothetical protein